MHLATELWTMVDARPEVMDADEHDVRLAWTSHLPQAVSTALALSLDQRGSPRAELGPGGRDVTRLAGSDPAMWADILIDNADGPGRRAGGDGAPGSPTCSRPRRRATATSCSACSPKARRWHGVDP